MILKRCCLTLLLVTVILYSHTEDDSARNSIFVQSGSMLGLKWGLNFAGMHYSDPLNDDYHTAIFPNRILGLTGQYLFSDYFSFNPDIVLVGRGQKITDLFTYRLRAKYVDIHTAFTLHINPKARLFCPYVSIGPTLGFILGGDISYENITIDVSDANIKRFNFAVRAAFGVQKRIPVINKKEGLLVVEVARHTGLGDTYSSAEHDGDAVALNAAFYEINGTRKHRGWEAQIGLLVPWDVFQKPAPEPLPEPDVLEEPIFTIPEKECYSTEEIADYYQRGLDIRNLKICLFNISFEFDKSELTDDSKVYIDEIAELLQSLINLKLQINGHTDSRGAEPYNQRLSEDRALAVYNYLTHEAGIAPRRLSHHGFGENKPIDTNQTDEGRARNRRVEFQVIAQ